MSIEKPFIKYQRLYYFIKTKNIMQKRFFPSLLVCLFLLTIGCTKSIDEPQAAPEAVNKANKLNSTVPVQECDRISFSNLADGAILSSVLSDANWGPITMTSQNPRFPGQPHAAMVFNSANPQQEPSYDLGTPNGVAVPGGPGVGDAGEAGQFINNVALGNILVIKNFDQDAPPLEDDVNGFITFDFPGTSTVTATSITVIDVELTEVESATVELFGPNGGAPIKTIDLPSTGQNGVAIVSLENTPGVGFIRINMNGSMGIDNIAFCRDVVVPPSSCSYTQGYWKNHGPNPNGNNSNEYPVSSLTIGGNSYTDVQLESILRTAVGGNGLISLAHQLIAAKLNIANGSNPATIQTALTQADALIATLGSQKIPPVGTGYLSPDSVSSLVNLLTQYNEGKLPGGPSHCD